MLQARQKTLIDLIRAAGGFRSGGLGSGGVRVGSSGWQPRDCDANHSLAPEGPAARIPELEIKPTNHFFACLRYGHGMDFGVFRKIVEFSFGGWAKRRDRCIPRSDSCFLAWVSHAVHRLVFRDPPFPPLPC
ncbi:hypothetical protein CGZ80_19885 [Rhodopirellula sp. MGV]|nr:hypothetical protein CGZ80_19885 [Rhodopirellula sp. MGV]